MKNTKRINYNDLIPYLFRDHKELPKKYLKSCEEFFESIGIKTKGTSNKQKEQATSEQAAGAGNKQQA